MDIRPVATTDDRTANQEGWTRADRERTFQLEHWDYDADLIGGYCMSAMAFNAFGIKPERRE